MYVCAFLSGIDVKQLRHTCCRGRGDAFYELVQVIDCAVQFANSAMGFSFECLGCLDLEFIDHVFRRSGVGLSGHVC